MKKKMFVLLAALLLFGLCPLTASADDGFAACGPFQVKGNSSAYSYSGGVLTVSGDVTIKNADPNTATAERIVVTAGVDAVITLAGVNISNSGHPFVIEDDSTGDVTLVLADDTTNTFYTTKDSRADGTAGIRKRSNGESGTLTIKGETKGNGKLIATGTGNGTGGIGAAKWDEVSHIVIESGFIEAHSGVDAAAIGGANANDIQIKGGNVKAVAASNSGNPGGGAGIGSAYQSGATNIVISGGVVYASGGKDACGIGAGVQGRASDITITGGSVIAVGNNGKAGIGGGAGTSDVIITGGSVNATVGTIPTDGTENVYLMEVPNPNGDTVKIDDAEYSYNLEAAAAIGDMNLYVYIPGENHWVQVGETKTLYLFESGTFAPCAHTGAVRYEDKGDDTHVKICDICGTQILTENHTGGTASCSQKAECQYCGALYGNLDFANHSGTIEAVEAVEPTATKEGNIAYWYCPDCGKYYKDAGLTDEISKSDTVIPALGLPEEPEEPTAPGQTEPTNYEKGTVKDNQKKRVSDIPETGDDSVPALWLLLGAGSMAGMALLKKRL